MKNITLSLALFLSFLSGAHAIDQRSIEELKKQGFQVRMGELTGAGSRLSITNLAGLIHPQGIIMKEDCKNISISAVRPSEDPKISDITKVTVDTSVLNASEFVGFFTFP